jgi:hypothetical protein
MDFDFLKTKQRNIRHTFPDSLGLRVHRAISWFKKAEQYNDDKDSQFIFLWVAFNAAYAQDMESAIRGSESENFSRFINKLVELDQDKHLYELLWTEFTTSIRLILNNQYVFQPLWEHVSGKISEAEWKDRFEKANRAANVALGAQNTPALLSIVLQRLYTLRNQLMHGGATWQGSANRDQIRDGSAFLSQMVPVIINVMMDNPNTLWGDANYPLV